MSDEEALGRDYLPGEPIGQWDYAVLRRVIRRDGGPPVTATQLRPDLANDPQVRASFGREAEKLRHLRHASIVRVEDVVIEPGELVLITEPADWLDLRRLLTDRGGRIAPDEAAVIGGQIAAALAAGHARGIRHLDLRPQNVLVVQGWPVHVKVNNFGLAALLHDAGYDLLSIGGATGYTAPEVRGGATPTAAADVYALGAILAELVTGARPDSGAVPDIPGELGAVVYECLAPDPADRPDASAVADRLAATGTPAPLPPAEAPAFTMGVAAPPPAPDFPPPAFRPAPPRAPAAPPMPAAPPAPVPAASARRRVPRGPLVTLAAGVVLAVVLGALSANAATDEADRRDAAAVQASPSPVAPNPAAQQTTAAEQPPPSPPPPTTAAPERFRAAYAGQLKGGGGSIAIAVRDGGAIAYLCDGNRVEAWLLGSAAGGKLNLSGPKGASLTGSYDKTSAVGSVTVAGRKWSLDIPVAKKPSGLYRSTAQVRGARAVAGWIVLPGGDQVGMVNTGGVEQPAPPLDLSSNSATVNGVQMTADPIDGTSENGF